MVVLLTTSRISGCDWGSTVARTWQESRHRCWQRSNRFPSWLHYL